MYFLCTNVSGSANQGLLSRSDKLWLKLPGLWFLSTALVHVYHKERITVYTRGDAAPVLEPQHCLVSYKHKRLVHLLMANFNECI